MNQLVQLNRYIRPRISTKFSDRGIDSQKGVTLLIELDYDRRMIGVQYAICNHSNGEPSFSKQEGVTVAKTRAPVHVPMWKGPAPLTNTDLTEYVLAGLTAMAPIGISYTDLKRITEMQDLS